MTIRTKLTLIFFALVVFIVSIISISIYFFSADYREVDFYRRLKNRAINTALVLIDFSEINSELLKKMERENPARLPMQFVSIYDHNNVELFTSDTEKILAVEGDFLEQVRIKKEIKLKQNSYEILCFEFESKSEKLVIIAGATDLYGHDALNNLGKIIIITFALSLLLVSILGWIYSGRVLKPISGIVSEVDNISEVNLNQRIDEGNHKDELSKLAQTFNRMLTRLEGSFLAQKNFIANASHELKTPFTVMAGEIEVTLLHPRDKEYYIKILQSVLEGIKRFNKLSTQLLILAQTSADNPQKRFGLLRVDDILWDSKHDLEKAHPDYVIDIVFDLKINPDALNINGDDQLLKVLLTNLMDNGCKYSNDSTVFVTLSSIDSKLFSIAFLNNGEGIQPDELVHIFDPFYRGKSKRKAKGFGIGLSLADKIIKLHGGIIKVESNPQEFTQFIVELPIADSTPLNNI